MKFKLYFIRDNVTLMTTKNMTFQIYSELINESQKEKKAPIELKYEKSEKKSKGCPC